MESPENSRTSQGDMDVSSLVKLALERGKNVALKQAEKTAFQKPQETSAADNNKLLENVMLWKQKIILPSDKAQASWDMEKVSEEYLEATSQSSYGGLESTAFSLSQSARPTSVTDAPYVPRPRPTPNLINLLMDAPTPVRQTNPAEYLKSDSAETKVELNLNNAESETTESAESNFAKPDMNLDFGTTLSATAESAKSYSKETEMNMDLPSTQSTTAQSTSSYSEERESTAFSLSQSARPTSVTDAPYVPRPRPTPNLINLLMDAPTPVRQTNPAEYLKSDSAETKVELNLNNAESETTESAESNFAKPDMNLDFGTTLSATAESAKSYSKETEMNMDLPSTQSTTAQSAKSDHEKAEMNPNPNSYEPSNYFDSGQLDPAETNPKLIPETSESSPSVDPQATPEDTTQETTEESSSEKNRESPFPHDQPNVSGQERFPQHGTSDIPDVNMNVHPKMSASSGLRWHVALERRDTSEDGKDKHFKKKKKKKTNSSSTAKDPADSKSPIIVGGIIGGLFMLMAIVACVIQLW